MPHASYYPDLSLSQHTGVIFSIDLQNMLQNNKKSGFQRKMLREEFAAAVEEEAAASTADVTVSVVGGANAKSWRKSSSVKSVHKAGTRTSASDVDVSKPADIATEDSLLLFPGQLLQTSKTRPDGKQPAAIESRDHARRLRRSHRCSYRTTPLLLLTSRR